MDPLYYVSQFFTTKLSVAGGINATQTTGIIAQDITGIEDVTKPGIGCLTYSDPLDITRAEWFTFTSINPSTKEFQGVIRGKERYPAKNHLENATIAFPLSQSHINNINKRLDGGLYLTLQSTTPSAPSSGVKLFVGDGTIDPKGLPTLITPEGYKNIVSTGVNPYRNYLRNSNMRVRQRGNSGSGGGYTFDGWIFNVAGGGTSTWTTVAQTIGQFPFPCDFLQIAIPSAYTDSNLAQRYPSVLLLGGKTATVSIIAGADVAGKTITPIINQYFGTGGSAQVTTVGSPITLETNIKEYFQTIQIPSITGKTIGAGHFIEVLYKLGNQTGTFKLTGMQLYEGSIAIPFVAKEEGYDLQDCLRYYYKVSPPDYGYSGHMQTTTGAWIPIRYPVPMYRTPDITLSNFTGGGIVFVVNNNTANISAFGASASTRFGCELTATLTTAQTVGSSGLVRVATGAIEFNAEP